MRRANHILILVTAAITVLWVVVPRHVARDEDPQQRRPQRVATPHAPDSGALGAAPASPARQREHQVRMGDPIYGPQDAAELAWLNRHLYPSEAERRDAAAAGTSAREDLLKRGPYTPTQLVRASAYMLAYPHDARTGAQFLERAAIEGSIHALEELGLRYSDGPLKNRVLSEAYYRAAMLRGHWGLAFRLTPRLTDQQNLLADLRAHQIVSSINRVRRREGRPPLVYDERPGLDRMLGAMVEEAQRGSRKTS